jgi:AcrR family transcriptional regulator
MAEAATAVSKPNVEKRDAILAAALRLIARFGLHNTPMSAVAREAGVAVGTVYLYFPSKEELLLAVHERNIDGYFRALSVRLEGDDAVTFDDILALTHRHIVEPPLFLPLAARCFGMMGQGVPSEAAFAFKQRMAQRLQRAGAGLQRHFPDLATGGGVGLLRQSYALIIGLWQMSAGAGSESEAAAADSVLFGRRYSDELDSALRALWEGTLG